MNDAISSVSPKKKKSAVSDSESETEMDPWELLAEHMEEIDRLQDENEALKKKVARLEAEKAGWNTCYVSISKI